MTVLTTIAKILLIGFAVTSLANIATTVYLHRALSHRALTLRPEITFVFRTVIWLCTGIKPRQWVAVHRKHHAFTDVDGDPHSPVLLGWWTVQRRNVALYRAALSDPTLQDRYARDLPKDRLDRIFFSHQLTGLGIGIGILVLAFGPLVGLLAAVAHTAMYISGSAAVNALGHHFGRRPYNNFATNLQWLAFATMGEGLHNNHHAAPSSARLSHRWSEIDFGWWVIRMLQVVRQARLRFSGIHLAPTTHLSGVAAGNAND